MIGFLRATKGNPRAILTLDPLWTIPFNMFWPFATMYMFALGLGDVEIGLILTVGMAANFTTSLLGGVIVDKYGRRKTLIICDFLAWSIPVLVWAFAQNIWWFLVAAIFNSASQIAMVAFECAWIDDTEEHKLAKLINWLHIFFNFAVLFALITGFFVERYTIIPAMRGVYLFSFVVMTARVIAMMFILKETKRGIERLEAVKDKSIFVLLSGYKEVFLQIVRSKAMRRVLILLPMVGVFQMVTSTFFALYATQNLGMPDAFLAYFPVTRSVVILTFFFFIQVRLDKFNKRHMMGIGLVLFITGHILLLLAPPQNMVWLIAYTMIDACATALFFPRMENLLFSSLDPTERARCRSLINVVVMAITSPFGIFAGWLSDMDRRLPFVLNIVLFICMIYFLLPNFSPKIKVE